MARPKCTEPISSYLVNGSKVQEAQIGQAQVHRAHLQLSGNGSKVQEAQIGQPQVHRARLAEVVPEGKSSGAPICYQKEDNNLFGSYSSRQLDIIFHEHFTV